MGRITPPHTMTSSQHEAHTSPLHICKIISIHMYHVCFTFNLLSCKFEDKASTPPTKMDLRSLTVPTNGKQKCKFRSKMIKITLKNG